MNKKSFWLIIIIFTLAFANCIPQSDAPLDVNGNGFTKLAELTPEQYITGEITQATRSSQAQDGELKPKLETVPTDFLEEITIQGSPTPDVRLTKERWKEWPVVPSLSESAKSIYLRGLALGNDPSAFSKVGDCQSVREVLLGIYGQPGRYILPKDQVYLEETIDKFSGSFDRDGMAVKGGYNAAAVLSPLWADPDLCKAGESPIECEFRIHKPSIVIISLEVWWQGRTVERYEAYMRQIIEYYISQGVLPILSTKADNVEGDHQINLETAKLAYEYDIPLWNFWLAVQHLPNQGIDPDRDGFHITTEAWDVRSFTALEAIDAVWRSALEYDVESDLTSLEESTIETVPVQPSLPTNIQMQETKFIEDNKISGQLVFGIKVRDNRNERLLGVWSLDFDQSELRQIAGEGYHLQSVSPDGVKILLNKATNLYMMDVDDAEMVLVASNFSPDISLGAAWLLEDKSLFYIGSIQEENILFRIGDDIAATPVTKKGDKPIRLLQSLDPAYIYWVRGDCISENDCTVEGIWFQQAVSTISEKWTNIGDVRFSSSNKFYAYKKLGEEHGPHIAANDGSADRMIELSGDNLVDYQWANGKDELATLMLVRSEYSGLTTKVRIYVIDASSWVIREYQPAYGLNAQMVWSGDDKQIITASTIKVKEDEYQIQFQLLNLPTKQTYEMGPLLGLRDADFLSITNLYWISDK